jgi:hypothetical protein
VGSGESALIYLGRYLYRGVIQENDIVACANGQVSFRYRNAKTTRRERRTVSGAQFLWLVLQHVLPKGFRRARNFGFLHPNCKHVIALLHVLLKCRKLRCGFASSRRPSGVLRPPPPRWGIVCPNGRHSNQVQVPASWAECSARRLPKNIFSRRPSRLPTGSSNNRIDRGFARSILIR